MSHRNNELQLHLRLRRARRLIELAFTAFDKIYRKEVEPAERVVVMNDVSNIIESIGERRKFSDENGQQEMDLPDMIYTVQRKDYEDAVEYYFGENLNNDFGDNMSDAFEAIKALNTHDHVPQH